MFALKKAGFRYDINGLRAWAVMSVLLFHFAVPGFAGGFAGVDVFFVISGLLMTDIIVSGLHQQRFQLGVFYLARAKRIFPALIVLVAVLLTAAWFVLPTPDYQELGSQSGYALGFISNIDFARADNYFDSAAHEKWLLHTWSLAAEWQFYMAFPLLLMLVYKLARGNLGWIFVTLVTLFISSFAYSVWLTPRSPNDAFYLLPARAWEMAAGGIVYMLAHLKRKPQVPTWLYAAGWLAIIATFVFVSNETQWPGPWAFFAVAGTMLVLLADRQSNMLIRHPVAQWLGLRSYSIYLWHWPLAVLLFFIQQQGTLSWVLLMMVLSLVLGHLSYQWVENPTRKGLTALNMKPATAILLASLVFTFIPSTIIKKSHFGGRVDPAIDLIASEVKNSNPLRSKCLARNSSGAPVGCTYGAEQHENPQLSIIVLGDSHAGSVVRAVERALPRSDQYVLDWTMSGCSIIAGIQSTTDFNYACDDFVAETMLRSKTLPSHVPLLIVNRYAQYIIGLEQEEAQAPKYYITEPHKDRNEAFFAEMTTGLINTACAYAEDRPVYMLRPIPEMPANVPQVMSRSLLFGGTLERVALPRVVYESRQARIIAAQDEAAAQCGIEIVEVAETFCDQEYCWGDKAGRPIYYDDDHLSEYGADFLAAEFKRITTRAAAPEVE
ncbi:acyltransferase family protein [Aliidiomarina quisquiliarum]|uniref:acyltransferase family protein n=1 Tax=Aliidiomarina quisquiliarum TaxID=2938947 RepID=UPI00208F5993|nr:acyltransferase family protein [Aliidiomarina quisquiliarum]MCO4321516.1 acyltransferase [Aliidiomarina quisquiliarum]